ncbi:hypothetical protein BC938DRAFT_474083 [Jimgerdemannia flammicorona]|uniref:Protein kinase domain-containing protein n=1 Tax=Jimgerdemannia flammicorona TaxID=994334 RepID=A0A433Q373_9FUNG|nr:hypothetical protein BC938DRAFT_474083 [Jimgerdemannia flammicorona]
MPFMSRESRESRESLNSLLARLKRTGTHCIPWRPTKPDPILIEHLEILEIPELENRLVFISPSQLKNIELHAQGGFANVYRARISWQCMPGSRPSATYALKELKEGMISEVCISQSMLCSRFISERKPPLINEYITLDSPPSLRQPSWS